MMLPRWRGWAHRSLAAISARYFLSSSSPFMSLLLVVVRLGHLDALPARAERGFEVSEVSLAVLNGFAVRSEVVLDLPARELRVTVALRNDAEREGVAQRLGQVFGIVEVI